LLTDDYQDSERLINQYEIFDYVSRRFKNYLESQNELENLKKFASLFHKGDFRGKGNFLKIIGFPELVNLLCHFLEEELKEFEKQQEELKEFEKQWKELDKIKKPQKVCLFSQLLKGHDKKKVYSEMNECKEKMSFNVLNFELLLLFEIDKGKTNSTKRIRTSLSHEGENEIEQNKKTRGKRKIVEKTQTKKNWQIQIKTNNLKLKCIEFNYESKNPDALDKFLKTDDHPSSLEKQDSSTNYEFFYSPTYNHVDNFYFLILCFKLKRNGRSSD